MAGGAVFSSNTVFSMSINIDIGISIHIIMNANLEIRAKMNNNNIDMNMNVVNEKVVVCVQKRGSPPACSRHAPIRWMEASILAWGTPPRLRGVARGSFLLSTAN